MRVGAGLTGDRLEKQGAALELDVIVYTGLGMDLGEAGWAFARIAPVQVWRYIAIAQQQQDRSTTVV